MTSCVKEEFDMDTVQATNWDPNFAAPLINSDLDMWDILKDYDSTDLLVIDSNQFIYLVYEDTVYSESAEDLINIPDQAFNYSDNVTVPGGNLSGTYNTLLSFDYDFSLTGGIELDTMVLKDGDLSMTLNTDLNYPATIIVTIPGATQNGVPYEDTLVVTGPSVNISSQLDGTKLVFDAANPNRLTINYDITMVGTGQTNNSPYSLSFDMSFTNLRFKRLYGYMGQLNLSMNNDTIGVKLYNNNIEGFIDWEDPRLYINVFNTMGLPIRTTIDYLEAVRTNAPINSQVITGSGIPNPWDLNYPATYGQTSITTMLLTKANSNIDVALSITPQRVYALLSGQTNPDGNVVKNHIEDDDQLAVEAKLELPFYGTASNFVLQDTFDLSIGEDLSNIDWIKFKIWTRNGFPVDGVVQLYFCDSLYNVTDSLLNPVEQVLVAATPGAAPDYIVTNPVEKMVITTFQHDRVMNLENVKYAIVRGTLNTYNNGTQLVKIYSYYRLGVRLSAQVQAMFNSNEF
ncbi:MAG: hypothetical protein C0592_14555 [Marinilabiliales bacterium]|nr:MAG: hypothetical protein C0592_14555 [Marinilabiliales bacterium]